MILLSEIMTYLIGQGMSLECAGGIYGNLFAESGCRADIRNDSTKEIGIAQFTGKSYTDYLNFCEADGREWDDVTCQLDFMIESAKKRYRWQEKVDGDESQQYGSVTNARKCAYTVDLVSWEQLTTSTNIGQTTSSFLCIYEDCLYERTALFYGRSSLQAWVQEQITKRIDYAKQALEEFKSMAFSNVKQNDPAWGSTQFGNSWETWASSACGVFACSIILGFTKFTEINSVYHWLKDHGYVTDHSGTYQAGIYKVLTAFGVKTVQTTASSIGCKKGTPEMAHAKEHVKKGGTLVLLMGSANAGTALDNRWTIGGHYIAVVGYDANKGFLVHDPANRTDGYHPWSDFDGDVKHIFETEKTWKDANIEVKEGVKMPLYKQLPQIKAGNKTSDKTVELMQTLLKGKGIKASTDYKGDGKALTVDGLFGSNSTAALKAFQKSNGLTVDGICGVNTWNKLLGGI